MRTIAFLSVATLVSIATFAACGGSDSSTIGGPGTGDAGAGEGSAATDGSSSVDGGGTTGMDSGGIGTNEGGGGNQDGGPGPGGNVTTLPCGTMSCNIPVQVCCVNQGGGGAPDTYSCATGSCTAGGVDGGADGGNQQGGDVTALGCTGQANCAPGSICCITQSQQGVTSSSCVVGTTCGQNSAQLCDPNASTTGCPATGNRSMCSSNNIGDWGLSPPFATCGGVGN
jgi:hypothetical protein